ncbi:hypothetical protein DFH09DRAFT_1365927 [Mycena vulgaris]|nr:hypothetical protein DFH09DRAFT_1365927 [Mycena vulgaris]
MSLPTFTSTTTSEEVVEAFSAQIAGKNVLITGTSLNGLGFEAARAIAKHANLVIITGYNLERLKLSEEAIKKDVPSASIRPLVLDLSSLAAVRKAAAEVNAYPEPIHVLVNNAVGPMSSFKLTVDSLESQMATAHIGPFLFTKLIAPKLLAAGTASFTPRVVFVSSTAHASGPGINLLTVRHPDPATPASVSYSQAKCANILAAMELSKRSHGKINAYSLHPGVIFTNGCNNPETKVTLQGTGILGPDGKPTTKSEWKTLSQGAATTVAAAFDTRLDDKPGTYLVDCVEANDQVAPHCSADTAEKLWTITEEIVGESFTF